jgi:hypothetical protein
MQTVRQAAEARGITEYDTALPQPWVDLVVERFGKDNYPCGHVVWSYAGGTNTGYPMAVDAFGDRLLGRIAANLR